MVRLQALQRLVQEDEDHRPKTHAHTQTHSHTKKHNPLSPMPHYPLLGVFWVVTPWQCQMSPRQGGQNCSLAGVPSTASHQIPSSLNTQCGTSTPLVFNIQLEHMLMAVMKRTPSISSCGVLVLKCCCPLSLFKVFLSLT